MSGSRLDSDEAVVAKFGVNPGQIVDYLALVGDKVDNIPGVDKCGPKTAAKWLGEYGGLDAVIANAGKVGGKIGENLRAVLQRLPLNRQLATIKTDLALDQAPADLALRERDSAALRTLYTRYGFNQALKELDGGASSAVAEKEPGAARGRRRARRRGRRAHGAAGTSANVAPGLRSKVHRSAGQTTTKATPTTLAIGTDPPPGLPWW